jgi:hypothetical protein
MADYLIETIVSQMSEAEAKATLQLILKSQRRI